jgi:signal peptidase I
MNGGLFKLLVPVLAWLAIPVFVAYAWEKWKGAPNRPKNEKGEPIAGPWWARAADWLLFPCIVALALELGLSDVFAWVREISRPLSILAVPVGLWLLVDSWIFAPRRRLAQGSLEGKDPVVLRFAYSLLPVLAIAVIVRMISAESLDFSLVLLVLSVATGLVWALDALFFRKDREAALAKIAPKDTAVPEPGTVDYARSFFPVAFIVLLVRAFIFEPFRIPSDSMMPTLLDGDFIVVNKYAYGLRWPVANKKFLGTGTPQRGDVVVFRHPPHPEVNYIKRLVGLPGDRVEVHDDHLVINGETIALEGNGKFNDGCYANVGLATEKLGEHTHQVLHCRSPDRLHPPAELSYLGLQPPPMACNRKKLAEGGGGYVCIETPPESGADLNDHVFEVVPAGKYLMIGDNRDNSEDSRFWGLVPEENLVGKATRIWFNFDSQRPLPQVVNWRRIGTKIE